MLINFYGCYRHESCGGENCSKIAKILSKNNVGGHRSGDVGDVPELLKKFITGDESLVYGYGIEIKAQS